jgi:hypothetical protein
LVLAQPSLTFALGDYLYSHQYTNVTVEALHLYDSCFLSLHFCSIGRPIPLSLSLSLSLHVCLLCPNLLFHSKDLSWIFGPLIFVTFLCLKSLTIFIYMVWMSSVSTRSSPLLSQLHSSLSFIHVIFCAFKCLLPSSVWS